MSAPEAGEGSFIVFLKNNYRTHGGVYKHRTGRRGLKAGKTMENSLAQK